jgi:hypothetical protein
LLDENIDTMAGQTLDLLQILRIKGLATEQDLADSLGVEVESLDVPLLSLAEERLIERPEGTDPPRWLLTADGLAHHAELTEARRANDALAEVEVLYAVFLELNRPVKKVVSEWQAGEQDAAGAADTIAELTEIGQQLVEATDMGARDLPRFAVYSDRLAAALTEVRAGQRRFIDDPSSASFHTVWFELHEDLLLTLGRNRGEEDEG